jgi:hypothetical protein
MEKIIVDLGNESFIIHLSKDEHWKEGLVYPIDKYVNRKEPPLFSYHSSEGGCIHLETDKGARCLFEFSFCWRGIWEGRIYFKDDEYWSDELQTITKLWNKIEDIFKERIKKENPDNEYDD